MTEATAAPELSSKAQGIVQAVESLTVLELAALVKALETKFGVTAAVPMAAGPAAGGTGGGAAAAAAGEKATVEVVLADVGANKIPVIKEIRAGTNHGLKEAKDLVDSAPKPIKAGVPKDEAATIKQKLEAVGAKVELK
ncbi:MAG: 50S ribosomal protein L7/L12 [Candidatus Omnitrophica bacterium]|nr:50S ribosomal protein L7/L12 [Candidatus Omnitrophota bacterium]